MVRERAREPVALQFIAGPERIETGWWDEADVRRDYLEPAGGRSYCEWKGEARYWHVVAGRSRVERAAWSYPDPLPPYVDIQWHLAFYAGQLDCRVDGIRVVPQPGTFYGGWITPEIVGPFKGEPGTEGW